MISGLIGRKLGMTQIFDKEGNLIPVTLVETGPCTIMELKEEPMKVKVGFRDLKEKGTNNAQAGYFKKINVKPLRIVKEFNSSDNKDYEVGQEIKADFFQPGDFVDVSGRSIGKGFQGGMKRWHWSGGPAGHGSMHHRRVGSIGASADPSRTVRGRPMPGQMGNKNVTNQGLRIMDVILEDNIVLIKGTVPGAKYGVVTIRKSRKKAFKSLDDKKEFVVRKVNPMKQSKAAAGKVKNKKGKK